ncbi:acetate--CoA ligase family protein [Sphingomonas sp.]|uniref:acetate--CoA ligase family protein n=1 Tax=Sphingomonas sp. TaxID=28214 RepID=UPI002DD6578B|nr:acetate--CoA ligase family protein [Sphingomonas sp.]
MAEGTGQRRGASRAVYGHADLVRLIEPRSIAIVGASPKPGSFGSRLLANLSGYDGVIYPVNAGYQTIGDLPCHPSLADLPAVPDCVVIAAPRDAVEAVAKEAVELGVGGLIVYAAGFAETGDADDAALQARLAALVAGTPTRLVGPNCIGICNFATHANMTFGPLPVAVTSASHAVAIVSQSGALGQGMVQAADHGTAISHMLTSGNACDVDTADYISYLAESTDCGAIACVFEGMAEPGRLIEAAEIARAAGKPLVVFKIATGEQGAAAAMSHTGSLAGSNLLYSAALRNAGAILVDGIEDVIETAAFFAKAPSPRGSGVSVVSTSGGGAIMCADFAEAHAVPLPQPSPSAAEVLSQWVPSFGSARNPCDVTAQVLNNPQALEACGNAILGDDGVAAVIYPHPVAYDAATPRLAMFGDLASAHGKFACVVWMNHWLEGPGAAEAESNPRIGLFRSMDSCFNALSYWLRSADARPEDPVATVPAGARERAAALLERAGDERVVTETQAKEILAEYLVPVVQERLCGSVADAIAAADAAGYPVVLKVESPAIPHKSEAGVVRLGLADAAAVSAAFDEVMANAHRAAPDAVINGVIVQRQVERGVEVMVGARIDPHFGPLVMVGLGGVMVELFKDTSVAFAPFGIATARSMLLDLKSAPLLTGFRGSVPIDLASIAELISRFSQFVADFADELSEIDINPVICGPTGGIAVDALLIRAGGDAPTVPGHA